MKPKIEALKELFEKHQTRQIKAIIKQCLNSNQYALTLEELHSEMQTKGYQASMNATKTALWRMSQKGEVMVSASKPRHYFVI
jgi:hypothetical protein